MSRTASFAFTPEQRGDLRLQLERVLGRRGDRFAALIAALELAVNSSRGHLTEDSKEAREQGPAALAKLERQLKLLMGAFDELPMEEGEQIDNGWEWAWIDGTPPPLEKPAHVRVYAFYTSASAIHRVVRWRLAEIRERRAGGGRPRLDGRIRFADSILKGIEGHGIPFSTGRESAAAIVLAYALRALDRGLDDSYDLLRQVREWRAYWREILSLRVSADRVPDYSGITSLEERLRRPRGKRHQRKKPGGVE